MSTQSDGDKFRAKATALYQKLRTRLILFVVAATGLGCAAGVLIGSAVGSGDTARQLPTRGWIVGGLIGLASGAAFGALVAGVVWVAASLIYVMTQDGA